MGVDWKIYKPTKNINTSEFIHGVKSLLKKIPESSIKVASTKWSKEEIQKLNQLELKEFEEYNGRIKTSKKDELLKLYLSKDLLDFGIFSTSKHSKDDVFGIRTIKSSNQDKPNLEIALPYSNKERSIHNLIDFLNQLNKTLWLNFRDLEQIKVTVEKLIDNLFDDKFIDSDWRLKHSHHVYNRSGTTKKRFENQLAETFRATGIRIIFPDLIGKFNGWSEYSKNMFSEILDYFEANEFEVYFNTKQEKLSTYLLGLELNSVELASVFDITNLIRKEENLDFQFLLKEDKSSITIEYQPTINTSIKGFTFYLYRIENNEFDLRLEIDKNAGEDFINSLIEWTGMEMEYSHEE